MKCIIIEELANNWLYICRRCAQKFKTLCNWVSLLYSDTFFFVNFCSCLFVQFCLWSRYEQFFHPLLVVVVERLEEASNKLLRIHLVMMEMKMEMEMMLITVSFVPKSSYSSTPRAKASSLWRRNLLEREESAHQQPQPPQPLGHPDHPNYPDQLDCIVSIQSVPVVPRQPGQNEDKAWAQQLRLVWLGHETKDSEQTKGKKKQTIWGKKGIKNLRFWGKKVSKILNFDWNLWQHLEISGNIFNPGGSGESDHSLRILGIWKTKKSPVYV